ncbi:hypothetical protein EYC84_010929 [Monilinia fructicola]|uniref:Uncharacterized protein n=1 Tax=Monilinia fructicola TaxID=38448 RepID=A0A5M9JBE8_MONFR|nr:hypothetical protein EYC84_010929 [Monilinia fructicola]
MSSSTSTATPKPTPKTAVPVFLWLFLHLHLHHQHLKSKSKMLMKGVTTVPLVHQILGDNIDSATFEQILEMDDDEDDREFSRSIVFGFF